jgi:glycerate-2-kinase
MPAHSPVPRDPGGLRALVRRCFDAGVAAVEPAAAVRAHARVVGGVLELGPVGAPAVWVPLAGARRVTVVAVGKAALPMAAAAEELLGARIDGGVAVTKHGQDGALKRLAVVSAGHPVPDAASARAAGLVAAAVAGGAAEDVVVVLLSGGASALLAAPAPGLALEDKQATTGLLLASGLPISAVNAVRKQLSALKGGRLAALAAPATVVTLGLSDVPGDEWGTIGSGPTSPDPGTRAQAWEMVRAHGMAARLPAAVRRRLDPAGDPVEDTPKPGAACFARGHRILVGSNAQAVAAAVACARAAGCRARVWERGLGGEAAVAGAEFVAAARALRAATPVGEVWCLAAGGETTVTLGENPGRGGRNQETALAAARALDGDDGMVVLAAGTDGGDGPTDAAGAVVDGGTWARARAAGRDPARHLAGHDAYPLLEATGDLLRTGQTGTNVMDLALAIGMGAG